MSLGDPLISDERLGEVKLLLSNGFGLRKADQDALFGEMDRLKAHNARLRAVVALGLSPDERSLIETIRLKQREREGVRG